MSEPLAEKLAYSIPEAIAATGIGRTSLYEEMKAGRLIARKRGSQTLILATDLAAFLASLPAANEVENPK